jgi:hypothetical protein
MCGGVYAYADVPMNTIVTITALNDAPCRYRRNMLISRKGPHGTEYSVKGYSGILIRTPVCGL